MNTIEFNKDNWTGENAVIKVYKNRVELPDLKLKLNYTYNNKEKTYKFISEENDINITVFNDGGNWIAYPNTFTTERVADNPFIALGQLIYTIF